MENVDILKREMFVFDELARIQRKTVVQFSGTERQVGHPNAEGPPVPIPNTEVKLCSAESTILETVWEGRSWPTPHPLKRRCEHLWKHGGVAQLGEHLPCKQGVMGSNPIISTKEPKGS